MHLYIQEEALKHAGTRRYGIKVQNLIAGIMQNVMERSGEEACLDAQCKKH